MTEKKTTIGGQALIEGILMRGPDRTAIAVRRPEGDIVLRVEDNDTSRPAFTKLPFIRGVFGLVDSLKIGMDAILYSSSFWEEEETSQEPGLIDKFLESRSESFANGLVIAMSILMSLVLFFFVPTLVSSFFSSYIKSPILLNLVEGGIRLSIFLIYIVAISRMDDMRRIFMYHGAEHKTIAAYEKGLDLKVENIRPQSALHPRCGTSFLFNVMFISIIVLSFFGWPNPLMRLITRILMLPIIAGLTYELNRLIGRSDSKLAALASAPGKFIQKIATIKEPDDSMIEVAIAAMEPVIPEEEGRDDW